MEPSKPLKNNIAELRKKQGLIQLEVAQQVGVRESTIANWENDRNGLEWFERIAKLCECLECRPTDLIKLSLDTLSSKDSLDKFQGRGNRSTKAGIEQWQGRCETTKNRTEVYLIAADRPQLRSNIAELRKKQGLTQLEVAQQVGVRESTIANWENDRNGLEWFERIAKLCECLECRPTDLIKLSLNTLSSKDSLGKFQGRESFSTKDPLTSLNESQKYEEGKPLNAGTSSSKSPKTTNDEVGKHLGA